MRAGWNPTRRNRNIGTAKSGHGQENQLVIPSCGRAVEPYWARITEFRTVTRKVHGRDFSILVEGTRRRSAHACTPDDLFHILQWVPSADLAGIDFLVLRQPKRKEEILAGCWGRLAYDVEIGHHAGPAIMLEAVDVSRPVRWSKALRPDKAAELERLREDGHCIVPTKRGYTIEWTLDSVRSTQLFRTLFHEIGHWVDYLEKVDRPASATKAFWDFWTRYHQRPTAEKEAFAHGYADRLRKELASKGLLPFARMLDEKKLQRDGLNQQDFSPE